MKDPLALWRGKDSFSIEDAAALICDAEPGLTYSNRVPEERSQRDRIKKRVDELVEAIKDGSLPADIKHFRRGGEPMPAGFGSLEWRGGERFTPVVTGIDNAATKLSRSDLEKWCAARGIRPEVFHPSGSTDGDNPAGDDLNARSRRTLLAIINALAAHTQEDLAQPHKRGGLGEVLSAKIEVRLGITVSPRRVADLLRDARDLPHEDCK